MKKLTKFLSLLLTFILTFAFVACGGRNDPASAKETLWIGNYDGASGHKWLEKWIEEYKKIPGNENVNIFIENKKDEFSLTKLAADMPYSENDIYFLDHVSFKDLVKNNLVEDITDVVTEKIYNDDGDFPTDGSAPTKSIVDMMYDEYVDFMNVGTAEAPQYYSLPFSFPVSGITYDVDLFNSQNWFFDKNGEIGVKKGDPNVGPGPDGLYETTYDNGEPETWNQFKVLLKQIVSDGYTPFTWSGQYQYQRQYFQKSIMSSYEGANNMLLHYTFDGTDSNLGAITTETGYKLLDQNGVLAACIAVKDIMSDSKYYSSKAFNSLTQSHTAAQSEFVYSVESSEYKQIAMLLESSYWEQEATAAFNEMSEINSKYAYGKRNFAMMSMPKFKGVDGIADSTNAKTTLFCESKEKCGVINKYSAQKELAKDFFQFVHSRRANALFTAYSNTLRPFDYEMTAEEKAMATPLMQSVIERFVDKENVDIVMSEFYNDIYISSGFNMYWNCGAKVGGKTYIDLFSAYYDHSSLSYTDLWNASKAYTDANVWSGYLK